MTQEQIVADLAGLLRDFRGRQYSGPIGPETCFFADLGFASIDAVVLAETLREHYHTEFPFHEFLQSLRGREMPDLQVGELAAFLQRHIM